MQGKWRNAVCVELYDAYMTIYREGQDNTGLVRGNSFIAFTDEWGDKERSTSLVPFLSDVRDLVIDDIYVKVEPPLLHIALLLRGDNDEHYVRKYTYSGAFAVEWETKRGYNNGIR